MAAGLLEAQSNLFYAESSMKNFFFSWVFCDEHSSANGGNQTMNVDGASAACIDELINNDSDMLPTFDLDDFRRILEEDDIEIMNGSIFGEDCSSDGTSSRGESDSEPISPSYEQPSSSSQSEPAAFNDPENSSKRKRKDKRNRRKPLETKTLLAQCLLQWLEDPQHNPSAIRWLSKRDGLFQITDSGKISALWGSKKGNKKEMNHEKLSRALRHYYKDGTLERMMNKKKLCYKFSERAMDKFSVYFSNADS